MDGRRGTPASTTPSWPRSTHGDGPLVRGGRRRHRQDAYPHRPGRAPARTGGAARADPAAHLHAAGGRRHAGPGRRPERATPSRGAVCGAARSTPWRTSCVGGLCRAARAAAGFSVLDPADAADVMDLLRDEHGLAGTRGARPRAGDARRHLLALRQHRADRWRRSWPTDFPWCEPHVEAIGRRCARPTSPASARAGSSTSTTSCSTGAPPARRRASGRSWPGMFDHVLVDEYQDVNALQVDIVRGLRARGTRAHRRRRRRPGHLRLPWRRRRPSARARGRSARRHACVRLERNFRSQPADPRPRQRGAAGRRRRPAASCGAAARAGGAPLLVRCHDAPAEARAVAERILERPPARASLLREQAVLVRAGHHSDLIELELARPAGPVPQVRRAALPRGGAREGLPRVAAAARQPGRRRRLVPAAPPARRGRARRGPARWSRRAPRRPG